MFSSAIDLLAFNKESNCLFGLIVKSCLQRTSLERPYAGFNGSITDEFPFVTLEEVREGLRTGCTLWKKILYIHTMTVIR